MVKGRVFVEDRDGPLLENEFLKNVVKTSFI
jgi:hypothetical protein